MVIVITNVGHVYRAPPVLPRARFLSRRWVPTPEKSDHQGGNGRARNLVRHAHVLKLGDVVGPARALLCVIVACEGAHAAETASQQRESTGADELS